MTLHISNKFLVSYRGSVVTQATMLSYEFWHPHITTFESRELSSFGWPPLVWWPVFVQSGHRQFVCLSFPPITFSSNMLVHGVNHLNMPKLFYISIETNSNSSQQFLADFLLIWAKTIKKVSSLSYLNKLIVLDRPRVSESTWVGGRSPTQIPIIGSVAKHPLKSLSHGVCGHTLKSYTNTCHRTCECFQLGLDSCELQCRLLVGKGGSTCNSGSCTSLSVQHNSNWQNLMGCHFPDQTRLL